MRRVSKIIKEATPVLRATLETFSDDELTAMNEKIRKMAIAAAKHLERKRGITFAEDVLKECYFRRSQMAELKSPRGGIVRDHIPRGYSGFKRIGLGHNVEELCWNEIEPLAPNAGASVAQRVATKTQIATQRYVEAGAMLIAANTPENWVRLLVAEAQYYLLITWARCLDETAPAPRATRDKIIETIIEFLRMASPQTFAAIHREAVQ